MMLQVHIESYLKKHMNKDMKPSLNNRKDFDKISNVGSSH